MSNLRIHYLTAILISTATYATSFATGQEIRPSRSAPQQMEDHEGHDHGAEKERTVGDAHKEHDAHNAHDEEGAAEDAHEGHGEEESGDAHAGHDKGAKSGAGHEGHEGHEDEDEEGGAIQLDRETMREFDITVETAGPGKLDLHTTLPGEVQVNQDRQAHIVPRYSGLVIEVRKHIGDGVRKGDVLAMLEGNESLAPYELKSLIDGTIIEKHITLGESLKEDDVVFIVADLSTVWIDLTIYQKDIALVRPGQNVIVSASEHLPSAEGKISYVSPTVDEHTRTSLGRVVLANPDGYWRPGMFVTGRIKTNTAKVPVVVAREAVIPIDGRSSVFVQTDKGLEPREVKLGMSDGSRVEILAGLVPGERYAARNVLPLKAELNRASLEHAGHAH